MKKENSKSEIKKKLEIYYWVSLCVGLALFIISGFLEPPESTITFGAGFVFAILYFIIHIAYVEPEAKLNRENAKLKREEDARRFKSGEMKGAERAAYVKKQLDYAEGAYNRGVITLLDLQVLQKMYTGKSMIDDFGLGVVAAASRKDQVNRAIEKQQKSATGSMIINAAVGEAIAGTAGAVIGAATSAEKSSQEAAALAAEKAAAEQDLHKAIEDSVRRRI